MSIYKFHYPANLLLKSEFAGLYFIYFFAIIRKIYFKTWQKIFDDVLCWVIEIDLRGKKGREIIGKT